MCFMLGLEKISILNYCLKTFLFSCIARMFMISKEPSLIVLINLLIKSKYVRISLSF